MKIQFNSPTTPVALCKKIALYCLATATGFFIAAKLGVAATIMPSGIALFWPANAVLLAALLLRPLAEWPFLALAILPAEILVDMSSFSFKQSMLFALVNIFESVLAAGLLRLTAKPPFSFARLRNVVLFGLLAVCVAAGTAGLLGVGVYVLTEREPASYWSLYRIWWFGDGLGLLIVTPIIHVWLCDKTCLTRSGLRGRLIKMTTLLAVTIVASLAIFSQQYTDSGNIGNIMVSLFVLLLLTVWAVVQLDVKTVASINLAVASIAIYFMVNHTGPFYSINELEATHHLQQFLGFLAFLSLMLGAFLQELHYHNEQQQILYRCIEAMDEGIMFADARLPGNPIIYANPALERMTGFNFAEMQGKNPSFLQSGDQQQAEIAKISSAIAKGETVHALLRNYRKDGSPFWNSLTISPVTNDEGELTHFISIEHDVSSLKKTEEALRLAHDQLDQANRE